MSRFKSLGATIGAVALATAFVFPAQATTMTSLLGGASIVCGDKTFFHFHDFASFGAGGADAPTSDQINGTCINGDTPSPTTKSVNPGPGILWNGPAWNVNARQSMDTTWSYDVMINGAWPGHWQIDDASTELLSFATTGDGDIHITETLKDINNALLGNLLLDAQLGIDFAEITFPYGVQFLTVNKDISLEGHTGSASLSSFKQNYSQTVPEPGTLSLLFTGLAALGFGAIKRKAQRA